MLKFKAVLIKEVTTKKKLQMIFRTINSIKLIGVNVYVMDFYVSGKKEVKFSPQRQRAELLP